jgi:hypothetical protein
MKNGNAVTAALRTVTLSREGESFNPHGIVTKIMDGCAEPAKTEKQKLAPLFR